MKTLTRTIDTNHAFCNKNFNKLLGVSGASLISSWRAISLGQSSPDEKEQPQTNNSRRENIIFDEIDR